ncbi:restriction endonuclease subunit S [Aliiroseovarius sp. S1123]|uniref:restriction endonuclease subunit S n=1 Tax=Aliiroseovarius sp. S1123 TaxID=2926404 RepID=UPI001FF5DA4E|nr:restriction endonuclease subunit S [Aliiroseovarius sp. S1123]MCK0169573.1 restriction endonuclease subunit S [Aliiroseovarius sp. S1123]
MSVTDTAGGAKRVPALRFHEFEGEWASIKAGDAFRNSRAKGEAGLSLYSVTMDRGLVPRDTLEKHMHGNAADETNLRAQKGDIVYNMMRMWQGAAGISELECMVSPAYVVLTPKEETSSDFFNYRIENARMLYFLWAYSHGLTSDRLRLYYADFARIPMRQPSLPEQKKIAAFLGVVDAKIAGLKARQEGLERYKRGLMQALFSQRLRFTKPDGTAFPDWEEKRLGEVAAILKGKQLNRDDMLEEASVPVINGGITPSGFTDEANTDGDKITISEGGNSCGFVGFQEHPFWCGGHCYSVEPKGEEILNSFLFQALKCSQDSIMRLRVGSGLPNIQKGDLSKLPICFPSFDEQQRVADALQAMDAKIAAVAGQVAKMEEFKKGLLQQMFV